MKKHSAVEVSQLEASKSLRKPRQASKGKATSDTVLMYTNNAYFVLK